MRTKVSSVLERLTSNQITTIGDGDHVDGGGLQLNKRAHLGSWVYRFVSPSGQRRSIGLGAARLGSEATAAAGLFAARAAAASARDMLLCGIDPWERREALRAAVKEARAGQMAQKLLTLSQAAHEFHARVIRPAHDTAYADRWLAMLLQHVASRVWNKPINDITAPDLLRALTEIRATKSALHLPAGAGIPSTVNRVRASLDRVFDDALFFGRCTTNPAAAVRRKLGEGAAKPVRGHYAALAYPTAPAFYARLLQAPGTVARCMEFSLLTASRSMESTMAEWPEFKLEEGVWTVPAWRMKGRKEHIVFLTPRAVEIVRGQRGIDTVYVFGSIYSKIGQPKHIKESALRALLGRLDVRKRTTVHGLCRATFSTWAYETTDTRGDVIEACLAHREQDRVKAAYSRTDFRASRRDLLLAWDEFLNPKAITNVAAVQHSKPDGVRLISSQPSAKPPAKYLRLRDVMEQVGLKQSWVYTLIRKGLFPKPIKFGQMNGWLEEDVIGWVKSRRAERVGRAVQSLPSRPGI